MTNRYIRQAKIIGIEGQELLKNTKVLVIGAGGLGNLVSSYLVASGVVDITIIDNDKIEITNLTRQIAYHESDCGSSKVITLQKHLQSLNFESKVNALDIYLDKKNVDDIVSSHDLILDCSDNFETKYLVSDVANSYQKPLITASIDGFLGQVLVLNSELCYRCVFPDASSTKSCFEGDVIGTAVGIIASFQANEAIKFITGLSYQSKLIQVDSLSNTTRQYNLAPDMDCINNHRIEAYINHEPKSITLAEAINLMDTEGLKILDIRKLNTHQLDIEMIQFDLGMLDKLNYKIDQPIAILCNYGYKSKLSAIKLLQFGYKNVYYIKAITKQVHGLHTFTR